MKHSIAIFALLGIVSSVAFASLEGTDPKAAANATPLPDAYEHAMMALGSATNEFHCTSAHLVTPVEIPGGIWYFDFYSTNGAVKMVEVFTKSSKWNTKVTDRPVAIF
jgi:hypothetical protein